LLFRGVVHMLKLLLRNRRLQKLRRSISPLGRAQD